MQCNPFSVDKAGKADVERRLQLVLLYSQHVLHVVLVCRCLS